MINFLRTNIDHSQRMHRIAIRGTIVGAIALFGGLLLTWLLRIVYTIWQVHPHFFADTIFVSSSDFTGWLFYSAHFVGLSGGNGRVFGENLRVVSPQVDDPIALSFFLVPIGMLVLAGMAMATQRESSASAVQEIGIAGLSISLGYGLIALVGTFAVSVTVQPIGADPTHTLRPDLGYALVLMGLLYPIVFATMGYIGGRWLDARR